MAVFDDPDVELMENEQFYAQYLRKLTSSESGQRAGAAQGIAELADCSYFSLSSADDRLIALLDDDFSGVRFRAAWALGKTSDRKAVLPLVKALNDEEDLVVYYAYKALIELARSLEVDTLEEMLAGKEQAVIEEVVKDMKSRVGSTTLVKESRGRTAWRKASEKAPEKINSFYRPYHGCDRVKFREIARDYHDPWQ